ncbi:MAG: GNAT family N-acetyltransferase [Tepidisphaeraceae bacterium]
MKFFTLEQARDQELELAPPSASLVDDFMLTCAHPLSLTDPATHWQRYQLMDFVRRHPGGVEPGDGLLTRWPGYHFWLRLLPVYQPVVPIAGTISLRLGQDDELTRYWGHVGYGVFPPARGHHYAERACRLILPLAKRHGLDVLWITTNPDNAPSRRTCERLGATLVDIVDIPVGHFLYQKGERQKCRYRVRL